MLQGNLILDKCEANIKILVMIIIIKRSKQREVALAVLRATDSYHMADWIYCEVRKKVPNVSLGTV